MIGLLMHQVARQHLALGFPLRELHGNELPQLMLEGDLAPSSYREKRGGR